MLHGLNNNNSYLSKEHYNNFNLQTRDKPAATCTRRKAPPTKYFNLPARRKAPL